MKYTYELDILEISRITDALDLWADKANEIFDDADYAKQEALRIRALVVRLLIPVAEENERRDREGHKCKICGKVNGH